MNLSGVLLAGGESLRMGSDKALLTFGREPLWQHQLGILREIQSELILISARSDPAWRPVDCEFVQDESPSRGPLSGLAASLAQISTPHLLVLAIDMPFMSAKYLHGLSQGLLAGQGIVPIVEGRAEPLAAIYPKEALSEVFQALAGEDFSMQSLIRQLVQSDKLRTVAVEDHERKYFRNLNAPVDLS